MIRIPGKLLMILALVVLVISCLLCARNVQPVETFDAESMVVTATSITPGFTMSSGDITFTFGKDSNISLTTPDAVLWTSSTAGSNAGSLVIQGDGNMVLYSANGPAIWATNTNGMGLGPYSLKLVVKSSSVGHLQLQDSTGKVIWQDMSGEMQQSEDLLEVAQRFAPVIQLDSREPFRPIAIREYIKNSTQQEESGVTVLIYSKSNGPPTATDALAKLSYKATEITVSGREYYSILYICAWTKDEGYFEYLHGVPFLKKFANTGSHVGDLEHVRVIVDKAKMIVARVFFGSHAPSDGRWLFPDDCLFYDTQHERVMAFAALGNHGMYPSPGVYVRAGLVISDSNDGKGLLWNSTSANTEPYPAEILQMDVRFGSPKIQLPHNQWFWRGDDPKSSTAWMRLVHSAGFTDPAADLTLSRDQAQKMMTRIRRTEIAKWVGLILTPFIVSVAGLASIAITPWAWFVAGPILVFWVIVFVLILTTGDFWLGFH